MIDSVAVSVAHSSSGWLDYALFHSVNALAGRNGALDTLMIGSAKYLPIVFALALIALWLSWRPRYQRAAFLAGISALIALGLGQLIGKAFPRPRPYLSHAVNQLIPPSLDTSFPSDHAILGFAVGVVVWRYNRKAGAVLLSLATIMALARVFVGAHYPSDVLGGAVLGALTSVGLASLSERRPMATVVDAVFGALRRWRLAANDPVLAGTTDHAAISGSRSRE
jgi:undecaprenyl-diphosphatase